MSSRRTPGRGALPALVLACGLLAVALRCRVAPVHSLAMAPTLRPHDRVLVVPGGAGYRRGDVAQLRAPWPDLHGTTTLLRVTALAGDHMSCVDDVLVVAGRTAPHTSTSCRALGAVDLVVPDGRVLLTGDAGELANDSMRHLAQDHGTVPSSALVARVVAAPWPPARVGADLGRTDPVVLLSGSGVLLGGGLTAASLIRGVLGRRRARLTSADVRAARRRSGR